MNPNEALQLFISIKAHFNSPSYDALKYNFKTKRRPNLDKRPDKFFFYKLAKHSDPKGLCIANFCQEPTIWVGKLFEPEGLERYYNWKKYQEGLTYFFSEELKLFESNAFKVVEKQHPPALRLFISKKVSLDTLVILDDFIMFSTFWNIELKNDLLWETIRFIFNKYKPFISYNREKIINVMTKHFFP